MLAPVPEMDPWAGTPARNDSVSPSTSLPVRVIGSGVSSCVDNDWLLAMGASFTDATLTVTVAVFEKALAPTVLPLPSRTRYVKVAGPLKFSAGVNVTWLPETVPSVPWLADGGLTMEYSSGAGWLSLSSPSMVTTT